MRPLRQAHHEAAPHTGRQGQAYRAAIQKQLFQVFPEQHTHKPFQSRTFCLASLCPKEHRHGNIIAEPDTRRKHFPSNLQESLITKGEESHLSLGTLGLRTISIFGRIICGRLSCARDLPAASLGSTLYRPVTVTSYGNQNCSKNQ